MTPSQSLNTVGRARPLKGDSSKKQHLMIISDEHSEIITKEAKNQYASQELQIRPGSRTRLDRQGMLLKHFADTKSVFDSFQRDSSFGKVQQSVSGLSQRES